MSKRECPACDGQGVCWNCDGVAAQFTDCTACDGEKICGFCEGEGYIADIELGSPDGDIK